MSLRKAFSALVGASLLLIPASAQGAGKFGADLAGGPQPQNAALDCGDSGLNANKKCTRLPYKYDEAGPINNNNNAPKAGTIDTIKLIAQQPGKFTLQIASVKNLNRNNGTGQAKITRSGPTIEYDASVNKRGAGYNIQTFDVNVPVLRGQYMAFRAKEFSAQTCSSGSERQLLFQPPPAVGGGTKTADTSEDCTALVQAIYE